MCVQVREKGRTRKRGGWGERHKQRETHRKRDGKEVCEIKNKYILMFILRLH